MNVTAVHTGTTLPLTHVRLNRHASIPVSIAASHSVNPEDSRNFVEETAPASSMQYFTEDTTRLRLAAISRCVAASATIFFVPAVR
jgi:hypothetical protein